MSQRSDTSQWQWDPIRQSYFYYDYGRHACIYQDGTWLPWQDENAKVGLQSPGHQLPAVQMLASQNQPLDYSASSREMTQLSVHAPSYKPFRHQPDQSTAAPALPSTLLVQTDVPAASSVIVPPQRCGGNSFRQASRPNALLPTEVRPKDLDEVNGRSQNESVAIGRVGGLTDPTLFKHGVHAHRYLPDSGGHEEQLFSAFKARSQPSRFFKVGKVFLVLWAEPTSQPSRGLNNGESLTTLDRSVGRFGELVHTKVRRFIVVREGTSYCLCVGIYTYNRMGVSKVGVVKAEHAIVHTGRDPPQPLAGEAPIRGEQPMISKSIRVDPDAMGTKLDLQSRIDFGKVYTIQHSLKVKSFGMVNRGSMEDLVADFVAVNFSRLKITSPQETAEQGYEAITALLLGHGNNVNRQDENGRTALSWAAERASEKTLKLIVEHGGDPNAQDHSGRTPLSWAAGSGNERNVQLLLDVGGDVNCPDAKGETPLSWANKGGHAGVVQLLRAVTTKAITDNGSDEEDSDPASSSDEE